MSEFLSSRFSGLEEYTPGEQPQDKKYIKLNTNESPYSPSKKVIEAVNSEEVKDLRLYCDPDCKKLKTALAELYEVSTENVFLSNGSDDILNFAFMAYGDRGAAYADITYGFYSVFAELHGVESQIIPLNEGFTLNTDAFKGLNKLVVIANPNAPTGIAISLDTVEAIVKSNPESVVLIDEAYVDFGGESCYKLTEKYSNDDKSLTMHLIYVINGWGFDTYSQRQIPIDKFYEIYNAKFYKNFNYDEIKDISFDNFRKETCDELAEWCIKNDCSQFWSI